LVRRRIKFSVIPLVLSDFFNKSDESRIMKPINRQWPTRPYLRLKGEQIMPNEKTIHTEVGSYISTLLRDHFGKGPTSVFVTVKPPFITIHLRGFLAP